MVQRNSSSPWLFVQPSHHKNEKRIQIGPELLDSSRDITNTWAPRWRPEQEAVAEDQRSQLRILKSDIHFFGGEFRVLFGYEN